MTGAELVLDAAPTVIGVLAKMVRMLAISFAAELVLMAGFNASLSSAGAR